MHWHHIRPTIATLTIVYIAGLFFLSGYAFRLIFVKGIYFQTLAEENRVRTAYVAPKRGAIFDRHGEILLQDVRKDDGSYERRYMVSSAFSHLLGYVAVADKTTAQQWLSRCGSQTRSSVSAFGRAGITGVEHSAECILHGMPGTLYTEVNAFESAKKALAMTPALEGDEVRLTIDRTLQQKAFDSFDGIAGAAIVMDARSAEIRALVSSPTFDASAMGTDSKKVEEYLKNPQMPMFDRALQGAYPPGSVFKMVVATAALETGKVTPQEEIKDTGFRMIGTQKYTNWLYTEYGGRTDNNVNLVQSLKRSNDIYYYEMGERLGGELLAQWAQRFGYGSRTGIELADVHGTVPSAYWKEENVNDKWFLGDTYNLSIGQGYLLSTPIQVAVMTQIVASRGNHCTPTIFDLQTREKLSDTERTCKKVPIRKETFDPIIEGMIEACTMKGTAWPFFDVNSPREASTPAQFARYKNPPRIACKTGTAEHFVEGNEEPHGWLTLFAPADNPRIVITVVAEKGGQGSDSAGPIARKILDEAKALGLW